jgi:hypothetical protein
MTFSIKYEDLPTKDNVLEYKFCKEAVCTTTGSLTEVTGYKWKMYVTYRVDNDEGEREREVVINVLDTTAEKILVNSGAQDAAITAIKLKHGVA